MAERRNAQVDGDHRWVWYGGRPSIDFVNTCLQRHSQGRELLTVPADLDEWFAAAGLAPRRGRTDPDLLGTAIELREAIDSGVRAVTGELSKFPAEVTRTVNEWLARVAAPRLAVAQGLPVLDTVHPPADPRDALTHIALDAAQLLGTDQRARVRICGGSDCGGRFVDQSAGGRRRWCQMATCGNRTKASTHRAATARS